jgi:hypothetical protein
MVAEGEVPSWRGEVRWECGNVPAGEYLLSIEDYEGIIIATTRVVKQ